MSIKSLVEESEGEKKVKPKIKIRKIGRLKISKKIKIYG